MAIRSAAVSSFAEEKRGTHPLGESPPLGSYLYFVLLCLRWDVSRGPWKKNGALHSVIRVSYQAATSACSRTSLRRW